MRLISKNIQELSTKMKIKSFSKLGFYGIMENKTLHDSFSEASFPFGTGCT